MRSLRASYFGPLLFKKPILALLEQDWLFVKFFSTVEKGPTLSAGRKILIAAKAAHHRQHQSFGDTVLTDRGLTTEIAQFLLGDLNF